jgi:hypothetical protein
MIAAILYTGLGTTTITVSFDGLLREVITSAYSGTIWHKADHCF